MNQGLRNKGNNGNLRKAENRASKGPKTIDDK